VPPGKFCFIHTAQLHDRSLRYAIRTNLGTSLKIKLHSLSD